MMTVRKIGKSIPLIQVRPLYWPKWLLHINCKNTLPYEVKGCALVIKARICNNHKKRTNAPLVAIANNPQVMLTDEPTRALDSMTADEK